MTGPQQVPRFANVREFINANKLTSVQRIARSKVTNVAIIRGWMAGRSLDAPPIGEYQVEHIVAGRGWSVAHYRDGSGDPSASCIHRPNDHAGVHLSDGDRARRCRDIVVRP